MSVEIPAIWCQSFGYFSNDSLRLLANIYLNNNGLQKKHSRELIIEALWNHANRDEFCHKSLENLKTFDTQLLLLLHLGLQTVQQLAENLKDYSPIEICLQLLNLQERMLVLYVPGKGKNSKAEYPNSLISKIEKQLQGPEGACFVIAPQFVDKLQHKLDFCTLFCGQFLPDKYKQNTSVPKLLLSSELLLASALYFHRESIPLKRKISQSTIYQME